MKLWVDDERPAPPGWIWVHTAEAAIGLWSTYDDVVEISFDHDLGVGGDTRQLATAILGMAQAGQRAPPRWYVHSANPVGKEWLENTLQRADHYWRHHQTKAHLKASYKKANEGPNPT